VAGADATYSTGRSSAATTSHSSTVLPSSSSTLLPTSPTSCSFCDFTNGFTPVYEADITFTYAAHAGKTVCGMASVNAGILFL
jgi:hypothetical protein